MRRQLLFGILTAALSSAFFATEAEARGWKIWNSQLDRCLGTFEFRNDVVWPLFAVPCNFRRTVWYLAWPRLYEPLSGRYLSVAEFGGNPFWPVVLFPLDQTPTKFLEWKWRPEDPEKLEVQDDVQKDRCLGVNDRPPFLEPVPGYWPAVLVYCLDPNYTHWVLQPVPDRKRKRR